MARKSVQYSETHAQYSIQADYQPPASSAHQPRKKSFPDWSGLSPDIAQLRQLDLPFVTAADEFQLLHGSHKSNVTFAWCEKTGTESEVWHEETFCHDEAAGLPTMYWGVPDVFMSQNAFGFRRSVTHLAVITCAWTDLDTRNVGLDGIDPETLLDLIGDKYPSLPTPTLAHETGRGIHLKWKFDRNMGRKQLEAWATVMQALSQLLAEFGADPLAIDPARLLRLPDTVNSKNSLTTKERQTGTAVAFEQLRCVVLDLHREHKRPQGSATTATRHEQPRPAPTAKPTTKPASNRHRQPFTALTIHSARLDDIRSVAASRKPIDGRKALLFHYAASMAWYRPDPQAIEDECFFLAIDHFRAKSGQPISKNEARRMAKNASASCRDKVKNRDKVTSMWNGRGVDIRYTYRSSRVIAELGITQDEMRGLRILIDRNEKERRRIEKKRAKGIVPRDVYLAQQAAHSENIRDVVVQLRREGMKQREIADATGLTLRHVQRILAAQQADMFSDEGQE